MQYSLEGFLRGGGEGGVKANSAAPTDAFQLTGTEPGVNIFQHPCTALAAQVSTINRCHTAET